MAHDIIKPYKICDVNRDKKKGIVASSLEDLLTKVPDKLGMPSENLTVVLESDGTEVDDEEYFSILDPDTSLMILHGHEKWSPNMPKCQVSLDQTDDVNLGDKGQVASLVGRLQHNLCHISLLGDQDLELLSDMDPDSLADIVTDRDNRIILEHIKEASGRILLEKRQAQDAMELLKLYHQSAFEKSFETNRLVDLDTKCPNRLVDLDTKCPNQLVDSKSQPRPSYSYSYNDAGQLFCPQCDRIFKTKFGYASHQRAHVRKNQIVYGEQDCIII